jgi:hypothetical protein
MGFGLLKSSRIVADPDRPAVVRGHWIGNRPLAFGMRLARKRCVAGIDWVQPRITESKPGKPNQPAEVQSDATNHQPPHRAPKILVVGSQRLDACSQLCEIKWWLCWFRSSELG